MLIDGAATDEVGERGHAVLGDTLLIVMNAGEDAVPFSLPVLDAHDENIWVTMVDTAREELPELPVVRDGAVSVDAHAVMLLRFGIDRRMPAAMEQRRDRPSIMEQHTL